MRRPDDAGVWLGGALAVDELAFGAVSAALEAAADLAVARGHERPVVGLSAEHVALSFRSERHAVPGGAGFAPMSRIVRCADGWARTHANYAWHAAALRRALAVDDVVGLERAALGMRADELESAVIDAGGCAAALRTAEEWAASEPGRMASRDAGAAGDAVLPSRPLGPGGSASRPASAVRVLDLTRVIAGPVAGRSLAWRHGPRPLGGDPPAWV